MMGRLLVAVSALAFVAAGTVTAVRAADDPPPWAWGFDGPPTPASIAATNAPVPAAPKDNTVLHTLPGSKLSFTAAQAGNAFGPADWFPEDHPAMPDIVAHGRESAQ